MARARLFAFGCRSSLVFPLAKGQGLGMAILWWLLAPAIFYWRCMLRLTGEVLLQEGHYEVKLDSVSACTVSIDVEEHPLEMTIEDPWTAVTCQGQ